MSAKVGHRAWGAIKKQRTNRPSYQASFVGPDGSRHYAPEIFASKMNAERWLAREKDIIERRAGTDEPGKPPSQREQEKKAETVRLSEYGKRVIDARILKPRTRIEYDAKWSQLIEPKLGGLAVRDLTTTAVRAWFAGLDATKPTRNGHAYSILNMICNTAVSDGLLDRNPCDVRGAMNPKAKNASRSRQPLSCTPSPTNWEPMTAPRDSKRLYC